MSTYDAESLRKYAASLQLKLLKYEEMRVNTLENEAKLQFKLRSLNRLHLAVAEQHKFIRQYDERMIPQGLKKLVAFAQEQNKLFSNSQETARALFAKLQGTKVLDSTSGEQLPMLSKL